MRLTVVENANDVGDLAAQLIARRIKQYRSTEYPRFVLGLPTGSTPIPVYQKLIEFYRLGELSFHSVTTFNMDEYYGLAPTDPQSYAYFMRQQLFEHIDIPPEHCHLLNGTAANWQLECDHYEKTIQQAGGIQLFLGGLGVDGHLAFNEPGSSIQSRTRRQELTEQTRSSNARFFAGDSKKVPKMALTIGLATLLEAKEIVIIATGAHKAQAIHSMLLSPPSESFPASFLQTHTDANLICDEAAAAQLSYSHRQQFHAAD